MDRGHFLEFYLGLQIDSGQPSLKPEQYQEKYHSEIQKAGHKVKKQKRSNLEFFIENELNEIFTYIFKFL